jgi:phosphate transport system substrate-binding protein
MFSWMKRTAIAAVVMGTVAGSLAHAQSINIDGSSTVGPITEAIAEEFGKETKGAVKIKVGISGTGGGMKKFVRGEIDVVNASRPIKQAEIDQAKAAGIEFVEIPVAFDALTVVVNPSNTWAEKLTPAQLKKAWEEAAQGKVNNWKDIDPSFPDQALKLYGPGTDSGTFEYFTEAVNGKAKSSRGDYTASEDDNVLVQGVSGDKGGLGYFGLAYYLENKDKVKSVQIQNKSGEFVAPSAESVKKGAYNPLARPIFIYVNKASLGRDEVKKFVNFYLENAADIVKDVKYVPLPEEAYAALKTRVAEGKAGSVFGGKEQIGMTIEQLVSAETK